MMPEAKSVSRLQLACDEVDRVLGAGAALLARSIPAAPCLWFSLTSRTVRLVLSMGPTN